MVVTARVVAGLVIMVAPTSEAWVFMAGLTVAALAIPAAMGFAEVAGLPPVAGLYALLLPVVAQRLGRFRTLQISLVLLPIALVLYGSAPNPVAATIALLGVGAAYMFVFSGIGTVVQMRAPAALLRPALQWHPQPGVRALRPRALVSKRIPRLRLGPLP